MNNEDIKKIIKALRKYFKTSLTYDWLIYTIKKREARE